jgi:hypothetical protein
MATINCIKGAKYDFEYYQNDELDQVIAITDDNGDPVNLSGKTLLMQIKYYKEDSTALAELSTDAELSVGGDDDNEITFSGAYDLESGSDYYDLRNTDDAETVIYGRFNITGDVSK